ncbi:MAG: zinc-ribbon domain-containing protein [Desulfobulbaceae bacterium]|nr:zinc-ribbon domain-containing protein [Desulfobulbaceae bacterium]
MTIITCPQCGQQLRIPDKIGGLLMACPTCGQKFSSDFKLAAATAAATTTDREVERQEEKAPKRPGGFSVVA